MSLLLTTRPCPYKTSKKHTTILATALFPDMNRTWLWAGHGIWELLKIAELFFLHWYFMQWTNLGIIFSEKKDVLDKMEIGTMCLPVASCSYSYSNPFHSNLNLQNVQKHGPASSSNFVMPLIPSYSSLELWGSWVTILTPQTLLNQ